MTKQEKPAPWRCACGKQMLNGEKAKVEKDKDGRTILICDRHPKCDNEPMSRAEWHRYRHLAAVAGEEAAKKWKEEQLPLLRKREDRLEKIQQKREQERLQTKEARFK